MEGLGPSAGRPKPLDAVVVGARDHVEIWAPPRWAAYSAEMNSPEALAGFGIEDERGEAPARRAEADAAPVNVVALPEKR